MSERYKAGSRVQKVWEVYERDGPEKAAAFGATLGLAPTTIKSWNRMWSKGEVRTGDQTKVEKAEKMTAAISAGRERGYARYWPERKGTRLKRGEEVSDIRWDNGVSQFLPNEFWVAEEEKKVAKRNTNSGIHKRGRVPAS